MSQSTPLFVDQTTKGRSPEGGKPDDKAATQRASLPAGTVMFDSPRGDIDISGGTFNAAQGDQIYITINRPEGKSMYRDPKTATLKDPVAPLEEIRPTGDRQSSQRMVHVRNDVVRTIDDPTHSLTASSSAVLSLSSSDVVMEDEEWLSKIPPQTSYRTYLRHLACKGRGIPLWIPQPNKNLPVEYQKTGVQVGDVVVITSRGNLRFFFNICLSADHPINRNKVPGNFVPLVIDGNDIEALSEFGPGSHLCSASVKKSNHNENSSGMTFESSASEGAVLTMPEGSCSEDLEPKFRIRKYVDQNIGSWYKYIVNERGHELNNGDLRVVIGHDKTSLWGMAAFSSPQHESDNSLSLSFRPIKDKTYVWVYSGSAEVKCGPDLRDINALRQRDHTEDSTMTYENQCLFVRTLNTKMQDKAWKDLKFEFSLANLISDSGPSRYQGTDIPSMTSADNATQSTSNSTSATGGDSGARTAPQERDTPLPVDYSTSDNNLTSPLDVTEHPSNALNDILLTLKPNARLAITEDRDWMTVIRQEETSIPSGAELLSRFLNTLHPQEEEGIAFVERQSKSDAGPLRQTLSTRASRTSSRMLPYASSSRVFSPMITLYDVPRHMAQPWEPNIWRIRFILNFKRLPYQTLWVELQDVDRALRHIGAPPSAQRGDGRPVYTLPVIVDRTRSAHQPVILSNTNLIAEYLESTYPARPVFPEGARAVQTLFVHFIQEVFSKPLLPIMVPLSHQQLPERTREHIRGAGPLSGPQREQAWQAVKEQFDFLAMVLDKNHGDGDGIVTMGHDVSYADFAICSVLIWIERMAPQEGWSRVRKWNGGRWSRLYERCRQYMDEL